MKFSLKDLKERSLKFRKNKIRILTDELKKLVDTGRYRSLGITLTFEDESRFVEFQRRGGIRWFLNNVVSSVERRYKRRDVFYLWILELQARGVAHYHILLILPLGVKIEFPDKWLFTYGMSNVKSLKSFGSNYLTKYLSKKDYQQDYSSFFARMKSLGLKVKTLGYSLRLLHESIRFLLNKNSYIKWFLTRVLGFKVKGFYEVLGGVLNFYYYKVNDLKVEDLFSYAYKEFEHIRRLFLSFFDFQYMT
ncbi:MAG: rolling circle replication-associated protein [Minisyncoccia bacterium]